MEFIYAKVCGRMGAYRLLPLSGLILILIFSVSVFILSLSSAAHHRDR